MMAPAWIWKLSLVVARSAMCKWTLTQTELIEAIFKVGVSTSPIITEVSGRGVGLDVVRRNVEALHGRINVDWKPGWGYLHAQPA
jgi:chemotaxis protein histidine kinase CheA